MLTERNCVIFPEQNKGSLSDFELLLSHSPCVSGGR